MFKVVHFFTDLQDLEHPYSVGDTYPRKGVSVTDERITELSSAKNLQGQPLIMGVPYNESLDAEDSEPEKAEEDPAGDEASPAESEEDPAEKKSASKKSK